MTLPWRPLASRELRQWLSARGARADSDVGRLLAAAQSSPLLSWPYAQLATGLTGSALAGVIARLVNDGRLVPTEEAPEEAWTLGTVSPVTLSGDETVPDEPVSDEPVTAGSPVMRAHAAELLAILRAQPGARVPGLVTATSWSTATVKWVLAFLKQRGDIVFEGAPKNWGYRVIGGKSRG